MELLRGFWRQKTGRQLQIGLGVIMVAVALLSALVWQQTESLWGETEGLYRHPLAVRRALGELQVSVLHMHGALRDLLLQRDGPERDAAFQRIELEEAKASLVFGRIREAYLGPPSDVEAAREAYLLWRPLRAETIRLLQTGRMEEAASYTRRSGPEGRQLDVLLERIDKISRFAIQRGDLFYASAYNHRNQVQWWLGAAMFSMLLLTVGVGGLLLRGVKTPLAELTTAANLYRQGQYGLRSTCPAGNEFGTLAASFNALAEAVQQQLHAREAATRIAAAMLEHDEPRPFCRALLQELMEQTGSQVAAVYLLNKSKTEFECFDSIGMDRAGRASFSAEYSEGELGRAVATRSIQHIEDIPEATPFTFHAVSGVFRPSGILTIPVSSGADVTAVVSLASLGGYPPAVLALIDDVWSVLSARLNGIMVQRKVRLMADTLALQNRELESQKDELARQTDELSEQNVELEAQKRYLAEASRLKSTFLSNMSHELRTPLNSVIALSGVLGRHLAGLIPEKEYGYLDVIERNGKHLLTLINQILDLARIESGQSEISLKRFKVRELVGEIVDTLEIQAKEKHIALQNLVSDGLRPIESDAAKCRHILMNLTANAVKFTQAGSVEIRARELGDTIQISVTDTGIGIEPHLQTVIFEEFRQGDERTARTYGGTGLGLSIAKKYAEHLNGRITVESAPGRGSTFTLTLPMALSRAGAVKEVASRSLAGEGKCILLVDDSPPALVQLEDILSPAGYTLRTAANGKEALAKMDGPLPDAIILDLMMPDVDGFQFLAALRSVERTAHLPVLILTAKLLTREELSFLKGNHIQQLIQKGDVNGADLLRAVHGTVFAESAASAPRPAKASDGTKALILIAEDNPDNLRTARALLQDEYELMEAENGLVALELARRRVPNAILMDLAMPVMDGIEALEEIRRDSVLQGVPVIALTASAMKGTREDLLARGFDAYVSKPIELAVLRSTLVGVLNRHE